MSVMTTAARPAPHPAPIAEAPPVAPRRRSDRMAYLLVTPLVLVLALVLGVPLVRLFVVSLQTYGLDQLFGTRPAVWVGAEQYTKVLGSPLFWAALWRTLKFVMASVGITLVLGLLIAHLLPKLVKPVRIGLLLTLVTVWAMPPIIALPIWRWLIDQRFGVLNYLLFKIGVLPTRTFNWFANPLTGWTVITATVVWGALPFIVIALHAAIAAVSAELVEAARLDGAGAWKVFTTVTLPAIRPTLMIVTTLSIIWNYRVFSQIWLLRDIGTNKEDYRTIGIWSYVESFGNKNWGYGAAISLISVLLLGAISAFAVRSVLRSTTGEGDR